MEIDDRLLTEPDDVLATPTVTKPTIPSLMDIPMPPPKPWTSTRSAPSSKDLTTTDDDSYLSASSTDQDDLRQKITTKEKDLRNRLGNKIMVNVNIVVRERNSPEGKLYPDLPDHEKFEIILGPKNFHNDYEFHQHLQTSIREAVKDSPHYNKMNEDGYVPSTKDRATYKTIDLTSPKHRTRYTNLLPIIRHHEYPNNHNPDILDNKAYVLVKIDINPGERDKNIRAKKAENIKNKEDQRQKLMANKQKEEDQDRERAIQRLKERSQKAGDTFLILDPETITAELQKMKTEKEQEDEECKKQLELRIQKALQKRQEEEQRKAHAARLMKQTEWQTDHNTHTTDLRQTSSDRPHTNDRQPKTIHAFSLYQSHNMAVKNCINAMKTLAVFDSVIPEAELAFKLRLCYQEFLTDSKTLEQHVTRRPQTQYEPRHPTPTTPYRKRTREEDDKTPRHHKHTQSTPNKRPKPSTDGWDSPAPKDWREANRRHLEETRQKQQRQQHNDSDWD